MCQKIDQNKIHLEMYRKFYKRCIETLITRMYRGRSFQSLVKMYRIYNIEMYCGRRSIKIKVIWKCIENFTKKHIKKFLQ